MQYPIMKKQCFVLKTPNSNDDDDDDDVGF